MYLGNQQILEEELLSKGEYKQVYLRANTQDNNNTIMIDISYENSIHDILQIGREQLGFSYCEYITDSFGNIVKSITDIIDGDTLYLKEKTHKRKEKKINTRNNINSNCNNNNNNNNNIISSSSSNSNHHHNHNSNNKNNNNNNNYNNNNDNNNDNNNNNNNNNINNNSNNSLLSQTIEDNLIINDCMIQKKIGSGGFGIVFQGINIQTKQKVALKFIPKMSFIDVTDVHRVFIEIQTLRGLINSNIIKMYDVNHFQNYICLIMEYAVNGDLKKYILQRNGFLSEKEAHRFFIQIVKGVYYCHSKHIVHRDIKLENILLDENMICKIADFGLSDFVNVDQNIKTEAGTRAYIAPEIVFNQTINYSVFKLDVWALGVLLFIMTQGFPPFRDFEKEGLKYFETHTLKYANEVSDDLKDLISSMLNVNPNKRPIMVEVLNHNWIYNCGKKE